MWNVKEQSKTVKTTQQMGKHCYTVFMGKKEGPRRKGLKLYSCLRMSGWKIRSQQHIYFKEEHQMNQSKYLERKQK